MASAHKAFVTGAMGPKSMRDLEAALANMARSIQAYLQGDEYAYLPVAVELRKLLCDENRNGYQSLVLRIHPAIAFHRLAVDPSWIDEHTTLCIPARIEMGGRTRGVISRLFTEQSIPLALAAWREQPLLSRAITIRELIKSVADKEAAHSDLGLNSTLVLAKSVFLGGPATADAEMIVGTRTMCCRICCCGELLTCEIMSLPTILVNGASTARVRCALRFAMLPGHIRTGYR